MNEGEELPTNLLILSIVGGFSSPWAELTALTGYSYCCCLPDSQSLRCSEVEHSRRVNHGVRPRCGVQKLHLPSTFMFRIQVYELHCPITDMNPDRDNVCAVTTRSCNAACCRLLGSIFGRHASISTILDVKVGITKACPSLSFTLHSLKA